MYPEYSKIIKSSKPKVSYIIIFRENIVQLILIFMHDEKFKDHSWIQDFEADFLESQPQNLKLGR